MILSERPCLPTAIGSCLLALPLPVAILIEPDTVGRISDGIAAVVMILLGQVASPLLLQGLLRAPARAKGAA